MSKVCQQSLFPWLPEPVKQAKPVNVSTVPQRSPFRYPGGKTWFVPTFRKWMVQKKRKPQVLVEPFVGGGIISLTGLFENLVERVVMVELDEDIAAVWQAVVDGHAEWLADRIMGFELSRDSLLQALASEATDVRERAFQTILKNRTSHGGIMANGSGLLKNGEKGKGICSRWYPSTLAKRFQDINTIAHRIDFRQEDGLQVMQEFSDQTDTAFFIDPPYTAGGKKAGRRLYRYSEIDHKHLFEICDSFAGDFLMTYDDAEEVKLMAQLHGFQRQLIPMTNTHNATKEELIISRNLMWMLTA